LKDVCCITEDFVVIVGNEGNILKTLDGGINWQQKNSGITSKSNKNSIHKQSDWFCFRRKWSIPKNC